MAHDINRIASFLAVQFEEERARIERVTRERSEEMERRFPGITPDEFARAMQLAWKWQEAAREWREALGTAGGH